MNKSPVQPKISNYEALLAERQRLEVLLEQQKNQVRIDFENLKDEFQEKMRPAMEAASFVKNFSNPRNDSALNVGANITIEYIIRKLFSKNILLQFLVPTIFKNYSSQMLTNVIKSVGKTVKSMNHTKTGMDAVDNQ
jgi:hypothetical protein